MKPGNIPVPAVRRLSLYLRQLDNLWRDDQRTISSRQLGDALKLTDAQVRKDLAYFGQFGQPGIGYNVEELIARIRGILGTDRMWNVLLVGAGHLGMALSAHRGFARPSFGGSDQQQLHGSLSGSDRSERRFDRVSLVLSELCVRERVVFLHE